MHNATRTETESFMLCFNNGNNTPAWNTSFGGRNAEDGLGLAYNPPEHTYYCSKLKLKGFVLIKVVSSNLATPFEQFKIQSNQFINLMQNLKMITVKVTYSVKENYVNANKEMIKAFLLDFKKLDNNQFVYTILQSEDGNTFTHISHYKNKDIQQTLLNVPSFLLFQQQRDKNLSSEPKIEVLNYIGSSRELFQ